MEARLMNKKKPLPKIKRQSGGVRFQLVDRDIEILQALNRYRFLQTGQIRTLLFPQNTTLQSTQRRLKYLYHNKYINRIIPLFQVGQGSPETAYYLDKKGIALLEDQGEEIGSYARPGQISFQYLTHSLAISQFRVNLEVALKDHPIIELHRFVADYEIKGQTEAAIGKHKYKLFDQVQHPISKESYTVYPDALIILKTKPDQKPYQRLLFLEQDQGTESLTRIKEKTTGYALYKKQDIFKKFGKFDTFTVLVITTSERRAANMRHFLTDVDGSDLVLITDAKKITAETILSELIWMDSKLELRAIVKRKE